MKNFCVFQFSVAFCYNYCIQNHCVKINSSCFRRSNNSLSTKDILTFKNLILINMSKLRKLKIKNSY